MPGVKSKKIAYFEKSAFKVVNSEPFAEISKKEFKILREF
jgi:hypothetical protein